MDDKIPVAFSKVPSSSELSGLVDYFDHDTEWHEHAMCRDVDHRDFFWYEENETRGGGNKSATIIGAYCDPCPVRRECLETALRFPPNDQFGIWGGTTATQRKKIAKQRRATREPQADYLPARLLELLYEHTELTTSEIHTAFRGTYSLGHVRRTVYRMVKEGKLKRRPANRGTVYRAP